MVFDANSYGPEAARILALGDNGHRPMPLAITDTGPRDARAALEGRQGRDLFPDSRAPDAALSGLWLYFSFFEEAHGIAQDIHTVEGSYWHGILHRQEPDPGNAGYWFRRLGQHPIFPALREETEAILAQSGPKWHVGAQWDPFGFIEFCEQARRRPGSLEEEAALAIQLAEWQLLFDYCARPD